MTHPLLTDALKEAYASCFDTVDVYETIEIVIGSTHLYYCTGLSEQTSKDENGNSIAWNPAPFKITTPQESSTGASALSVTIENVDGKPMSIVNSIRAQNEIAYLKYRTYMVGVDTPQNPRPIKLELVSGSSNLGSITFQAAIPDIVNRSFPNDFYSYASFPGLRG